MPDAISLTEIKAAWNQILDTVESSNRIAWLAYFDARLVSLVGFELTLDFSDSAKFSGSHDFATTRNPLHRAELERAILEITGVKILVIEE